MKTTKVILLLLVLGTADFAMAQDYNAPAPPPNPGPPPTGYFELGIGAAQPINMFAANNGGGYGGYALPGTDLFVSLGVPIAHSNFGIGFMYNYAWNFFDINTYVNNIQISDQSNSYTPLLQDEYRQNFFLAGLYATIPVDRLSFDFRLLGGVDACYLPELDYGADATSPTASQNFEWDTYSSTSTAFATDAGFNLRVRIFRTSIMAGVDYLYSDPILNTTQRYTDQYGNSTYSHVGGTVPVSILSYSLGIGYQFR